MMWMMICIAVTAAAQSPPADQDIVLADFEGPDYGEWIASGDAFGDVPASGTLPGQMVVSGFEGHGLVNSYRGGDASLGRLVSPGFVIARRAISFLIGGGGWPGRTCMNLVVEGAVVRSATGPNTRDGGSEALERVNWDVSEFLGRTARIEVVDDANGGWGHINVDQIILTDRPMPGVVENPSRVFDIGRRYLNLPIRDEAPMRRLTLSLHSRIINEFEASITDQEPAYWVFIDASPWMGGSVTLTADRLPAEGAALGRVVQSDDLIGSEPLYAESLRPQFHFSSRRGWLNDPNGLVYSQGEYHLFYQHNPFGWHARNMHWGHAVSPDLVHWTELPTALAPHTFGDWVWSGSAVVDSANTAGWKRGDNDVLVAAFTSTGRGECIAYSTDKGRTFTEYDANPVVTHANGEGRDPRLLWYAPPDNPKAGHWVMAVYDEDRRAPEADRRGVAFYTSPDLKSWTYRSRIGGFFECPDMFELPVDGGAGGKKWVLTAADSNYLIGQFDGQRFTPDTPGAKLPGNRGDRFYAAQTFTGVPDDRRIQIGWGRIDSPGMPFNQMMSFPCELTLRSTPGGVRMFGWPVREIERLYGQTWTVTSRRVEPAKPLIGEIRGESLDVVSEVQAGNKTTFDLVVRGMTVRVDAAKQQIECGGRSAPLAVNNQKVSVRVLADRTSLEVFANHGEVAMLLAGAFTGDRVELRAQEGPVTVEEFSVRQLKSAWNRGP